MLKKSLFYVTAFVLSFTSCETEDKWKLVWQDDFSGSTIDTTYWSKISRGTADWERHMSYDESLYEVKDGNLILYGKVNTNPDDTVKVITGGISSRNKITMKYGKLEIRAKLESAKSAWPAFWMLPNGDIKWPRGGEIDIMEHLNHDTIVYQTAHTYYTYVLKEKLPLKSGVSRINIDEYNKYGLEWYPDSLVFFVNDVRTFAYPKIETDKEGQWPFTTPYYILLDMQIGGAWVGAVDTSELPVKMEIDWVRMYEERGANRTR